MKYFNEKHLKLRTHSYNFLVVTWVHGCVGPRGKNQLTVGMYIPVRLQIRDGFQVVTNIVDFYFREGLHPMVDITAGITARPRTLKENICRLKRAELQSDVLD